MAKKGHNYDLLQKVNRRLHLMYYTQLNMLTKRDMFDRVECYCMFIGYPRSGHTLIGASLDAHPNIVLGHEMDALKYVMKGESRNKVYSRLLAMSKTFITIGGQWMNYNYKIEGQYQGQATDLKIIGDKKGGGSTNKIRRDPALLEKLKSTVGDQIKMIHVTRNPFDIITTRARGGNLVLAEIGEKELLKAADDFFKEADTVVLIKERGFDVYDLKHEAYIDQPAPELKKLCDFMGLPAPDQYLNACAEIVFKKAHQSRHDVNWTPNLKQKIKERMDGYAFLQDYTFDV